MERHDVVIVGGGPAGIATAAALLRDAPALAAGALLLEKETHPRPKLCGGGLTPLAGRALAELGLDGEGVPAIPIETVRVHAGPRPIEIKVAGRVRIVERRRFDAHLMAQVRAGGFEIREGERLERAVRDGEGVVLETSRGALRAKVVVGADGATGRVRRDLVPGDMARVSRLLETVMPADPADTPELARRMLVIDGRPIQRGLQGYLWEFPALLNDRPALSVGVFDSRVREGERAPLKELLLERLRERGGPAGDAGAAPRFIEGHPERWYHARGRYAAPHALLVGDAAGVEPWFGEGISLALAYGTVAAAAIRRAFDSGDYTFASYAAELARSPCGRILRRNSRAAGWFYHPLLRPLLDPASRLILAAFAARTA